MTDKRTVMRGRATITVRSAVALAFLLCTAVPTVVGGLSLGSGELEAQRAVAASQHGGRLGIVNGGALTLLTTVLIFLLLTSAWAIWKGLGTQGTLLLFVTLASACLLLVYAWLVNASIENCLNRDPCDVAWGAAQSEVVRSVILMFIVSGVCFVAFIADAFRQLDR